MIYLEVSVFFVLLAVAPGHHAISPVSWRKVVILHIQTCEEWFTVQQLVRATMAPRHLVIEVIAALVKSGVLHAIRDSNQCAATSLPQPVKSSLEAIDNILGAVRFAPHCRKGDDLREFHFCIDRTTDPVSIPEMDALRRHRKRPV